MKAEEHQMKGKYIRFDFASIYICLFIIIILRFFIFRLVRGADMTDETFYSTLAYRLVQGNHVLTDMWEQCSTAAVLPAILLKIRHMISGNFDGIVLFFRYAFFIFNLAATFVLFSAQKYYLNKKYALLLSLFYFIYGPFHMYTFSYNHMADMLIMLVINTILLAIEKENVKIFFIAGCLCAFLAFTYPTMLFLCPILVLLLLFSKKVIKNGWLYFIGGGFCFAVLALTILLLTIGTDGIIIGIKGILSDPAYSIAGLPINKKISNAIQYLLTPIIGERGFWIRIYFGWMFVVFCLIKKSPEKFAILKLSITLYPMAVCAALFPVLQAMEALGIAMFIFYLSLPCPFMVFFTRKYKRIFCKFLYFEWLPIMLFYLVISVSSHGGAVQAIQGLLIASFVMLKETIFILDETFEELHIEKANFKQKIKQWVTILVLSITISCELYVFYSTVYRDGQVKYLTEKIETGPYKGIYTTIERKIYLEEMTKLLADIQEEDKSACVLYQTNFAYLMLNMLPATPTTWGVYPHIDNQNVYYEYFKLGKEHIPDVIFVIDVPEMYNYCGQREEYYYDFCVQLKSLIADNYILTEDISIYETGCIRKYALNSNEKEFGESLERVYDK